MNFSCLENKSKESYVEALSTPALPLLIRIFEYKLAANLVLDVVHLCSDEGHDCLAIDDHLDSLFFKDLIELAYLVGSDVVHRVSQPRASFFSEADLHAYLHHLKTTNLSSFFSPMISFSRFTADDVFVGNSLRLS